MNARILLLVISITFTLSACSKKADEVDAGNSSASNSGGNSSQALDPKVAMQNAVEASCGNLGMMIVRTRQANAKGKPPEPVFSKQADEKILKAAGAMLNLAREAQQRGQNRKAGEYASFKKKVQDSVLAAGKAVKTAAPKFFTDCERELGPNIKKCMTIVEPQKQRDCMGQAKPKMIALVKKYDNQFKSLQDRARSAAAKIAAEKQKLDQPKKK